MKAYELINGPGSFFKGFAAADSMGKAVSIDDPSGCKFCIYGAIRKVYPYEKCDYLMQEIISTRLNEGRYASDWAGVVFRWNDDPERTWEEVHNLLKELDL